MGGKTHTERPRGVTFCPPPGRRILEPHTINKRGWGVGVLEDSQVRLVRGGSLQGGTDTGAMAEQAAQGAMAEQAVQGAMAEQAAQGAKAEQAVQGAIGFIYIYCIYMKSSDAKASKCHLKFLSKISIFLTLLCLGSVISL